MSSEKEKMLAGQLYDSRGAQLSADRRRARLLLKALNDTRDDQVDESVPPAARTHPRPAD